MITTFGQRSDPYRRLLFLVGTVVAIGVLVGSGVLLVLQQALVQRTGDTVAMAAAMTASRLDRMLFERFGDARMMAQAFSGRVQDHGYLSAYVGWMAQAYPVYEWLAVLDPTGRVISTNVSSWLREDRSQTDWFPLVQQGAAPLILDARAYTETNGHMAVGFAAAIHGPHRELQGFVVSFVSLRLVEESYLEMDRVLQGLGQRDLLAEYVIVDRTGLVIIDSRLHKEGQANLADLPSVRRLRERGSQGYAEEWSPRYHAEVMSGYARTRGYHEMPDPQWGVLVRVPREQLLEPIRRLTWLVGLGGAVVVGLLLTMLVTMMLRLRRQMESVEQSRTELERRVGERTEELVKKQQQLVQTAKLASLGELSAGIAHELNNPLNNINLFVHNALDQVDQVFTDDAVQQRLHTGLDMALHQIDRATRIINNLRSFARASGTDMGTVRLADVIQDSVALLHQKLHLGSIEVTVTLGDQNAEVRGNRLQLEQVLVNLLTNASDALESAAVKRITVSGETDKEWHVLTVTDTGAGIPEEMLPRIFDPFFTTKQVGEGTGLGLSIVYGIIKDHGGHISVHSEPGQGTSFEIRLPVQARRQTSTIANDEP